MFSNRVCVCAHACKHALSDGYGWSFRVNFIFFLIWLNIVWLEAVAFWGLLVSFSAEHPSVTESISKGYLSGKRKWYLLYHQRCGIVSYSYFKKSMHRNRSVRKEDFQSCFLPCFVLHLVNLMLQERNTEDSVVTLAIGKMY